MILFEGLDVSGLLDFGAMKTFISRELIRQVPGHQVVQLAAADMLKIQSPNGEEVQSEGNVRIRPYTVEPAS